MTHYIWISKVTLDPGQTTRGPDGPGAVFVLAGTCQAMGAAVSAGEGRALDTDSEVTNPTDQPAEVLIYGVTRQGPNRDTLSCEPLTLTDGHALLRLDEVSFPPGAIAYRHTHPGAGFRYLRRGALHLQADDHSFDTLPGAVWFEPAQSPVRATASDDHAETRFVRFMVLPVEFEGKPTINILDPKDAALPKRQSTHRHVDQIVRL